MCYGVTLVEEGPFKCYKLGPAVSDLSQCSTTTEYDLGHTFVKKNRRNGTSFINKNFLL